MSYKLEKIEGIGAHFAQTLANAKVHTTKDLLQYAKKDDGLKELSARTSIPVSKLEVWANRADLMRVPGIGTQYSELLEESGVESVAELSVRNPANLLNLVTRVNAEKKLARSLPTMHVLTQWVMRAQDLATGSKSTPAPFATSNASSASYSAMASV